MKHEDTVLLHLAKHGTVTIRELVTDYNMNSPQVIIKRLRDKGHNITDTVVKTDKTWYKVYRLELDKPEQLQLNGGW